MALDLVPSGFIDEKWTQQVHDGCGGEIVMVVKREQRQMGACCKGCRKIWSMPQVEGWPENWKTPDPARAGSRIILPNGRS